MNDALRASFEAAARRKFGWDDKKLKHNEEGPGVYTDPEVQVAFNTWVMAKADSVSIPEGWRVRKVQEGVYSVVSPNGNNAEVCSSSSMILCQLLEILRQESEDSGEDLLAKGQKH